MSADQLSPKFADPLQAPPRGPSAFDDDPIAVAPSHRRADCLSASISRAAEPPAFRRVTLDVYLAGMSGTAFAGGLFPSVVALIMIIFSPNGRRPAVGEVAGLLLGGFPFGFAYALAVALFVFPLMAMVQYLASLSRWRGLFAAAAGGWTGFAAVAIVGSTFRGNSPFPIELLTLGLVAMLMGQVGAGRAAAKARRTQMASRWWHEPPGGSQFTLRQLMGLTAAVAILAAVFSALRLAPAMYVAIGIAAAFQCATVGAYLLISRHAARNGLPVAVVPSRERST